MTGGAATRLDRPDPVRLALDVRRDAVTLRTGAWKFSRFGDAQHREPVAGGVILCGRVVVRGDDGAKIHRLPGLGSNIGGIDESVAADEQRVLRSWKIRQQVPSLVVRHDDLGEWRGEIVRPRD